MKLQFNKTYFLVFAILLIIETLIAIFLKTGFIRHTLGDFLVVILLYCFLKSFINAKPLKIGVVVLCIAFIIEFLQLFELLKLLNLQNNHAAQLLLGSTFQITDLIAYVLGVLFVIFIEKIR